MRKGAISFMNIKEFIEQHKGREVELFLPPDMPGVSGTLLSCEDDFLVLEDSVWSYKAVLGVRPVKKLGRPLQVVAPVSHVSSIPSDSTASVDVQKSEVKEPLSKSAAQELPTKPEKTETSAITAPVTAPAATAAPAPDKAGTPKTANDEEYTLPDREFTGMLTSFAYDHKRWGFIESPDVIKAGVPLRDGVRVFVHLNQISDENLKKKLMQEKPETPMIAVKFRLIKNRNGIAADDVRPVAPVRLEMPVKIGEIIAASMAADKSAKNTTADKPAAKPNTADDKADASADNASTEAKPKNAPADEVKEIKEEDFETGEIDYYHRYDAIPNGQVRIKGNQLFRFTDEDVIDPVLMVFLELTPNAEGQAVKFIRQTTPKNFVKATKIKAAEPFPEEKLKAWADMIEKAKAKMSKA